MDEKITFDIPSLGPCIFCQLARLQWHFPLALFLSFRPCSIPTYTVNTLSMYWSMPHCPCWVNDITTKIGRNIIFNIVNKIKKCELKIICKTTSAKNVIFCEPCTVNKIENCTLNLSHIVYRTVGTYINIFFFSILALFHWLDD